MFEFQEPVEIKTYAKINLGLKVLGKRDDGFHELVTLMHEIDLWDSLEVKTSKQDHLSITGSSLPVTKDNLLFKTLERVRGEGYEVPGLEMKLLKKIPVGGGLGGGSSNAIGLLCLLGKMLGLDQKSLHALAGNLGSDTNFFIEGGTSLCRGRGELIEPLAEQDWFFNLVFPDFSCSTPKVFGEVALENRMSKAISSQVWERGEGYGENDLQVACFRAYPEMEELFSNAGDMGLPLFLSGSGSTCFTFSSTAEERDRVSEKLKGLGAGLRVLPARSHHRDRN